MWPLTSWFDLSNHEGFGCDVMDDGCDVFGCDVTSNHAMELWVKSVRLRWCIWPLVAYTTCLSDPCKPVLWSQVVQNSVMESITSLYQMLVWPVRNSVMESMKWLGRWRSQSRLLGQCSCSVTAHTLEAHEKARTSGLVNTGVQELDPSTKLQLKIPRSTETEET